MVHTADSATEIAGKLADLRDRIRTVTAQSGRPPDAVRLILVTKTVDADRIRGAVLAGQYCLGENKVQEGRRKAEMLSDLPVRWAMIGHLQTNKVKEVLRFASEVQSLDRLSLALALEKRLQALGRRLEILVQVNTSGEASKYGLAPRDVPRFLQELAPFDCLHVRGFMTLARFTPNQDEARRCFRLLRSVRDRARDAGPLGAACDELSMGMSSDFETAIEEGATIVRVGQAIFGPRRLSDSHYWPQSPAR